MGRGAAAGSAEEILYGDHARTSVEEINAELTPRQETAIKALALLRLEHPSAPGFDSSDVSGTASLRDLAPSPDYTIGSITAGPIMASLAKKSLAKRSQGVLLLDLGIVRSDQPGWLPTAAGLELANRLSA